MGQDLDSPDVPLIRNRLPIVILAGGVAIGLAVVALITYVLVKGTDDHPPTNAERQALAEEVCPRVQVTHLYRIEKQGKTSYVLGTRHSGVSLARFPGVVAETFHRSKVLAVEALEREDTTSAPVQARPVAEMLGPKAWAHYRELVGAEAAERASTDVARATATLALLYEDLSQMIDVELQRLAKQANKRLVALDVEGNRLRDEYLGIDTLRTAVAQVRRRELLEQEVRRSLGEYCRGAERKAAEAFRAVTEARTRQWVTPLLPLLAEGDAFIAVGIDHVDGGGGGLVSLLRSEGFAVQPVN